MKKLLIGFLSIVSIHFSLFADTVHMKDGDVIKGKIISQNKELVIIKVGMTHLSLKKAAITRVQYTIKKNSKPETTVHLKNGKSIRGNVVQLAPDSVVLLTASGKKRIKTADIKRVDGWKFFRFSLPVESNIEPVWRSLLLPSWGQFYRGKTTKGWLIAGGMAGLTAASIISYINLQNAKDLLSYPTESRYADYKSKRNTFNTFLVITLVGWGLNVLDAAVFPGTPLQKADKGLAMEYNYNIDGPVFSVRFRF